MKYIYDQVKIPIYTGILHVFVYKDKNKMIKKHPKKKSSDAWAYKHSDFNYCVVMHKDSKVSSLAHEATHIKNLVFGFHGLKLDPDNDEAEAYFLTWVFEELYRVLNKC